MPSNFVARLAWVALAAIIAGTQGCAPLPTAAPESVQPLAEAQPARIFHLRYVTTVQPATAGRSLRLWIPLPQDDAHQRVRNLVVTSPFPYRLTSESLHGNRMVFVETPVPCPGGEIVVEYDVDRIPYRVDLDAAQIEVAGAPVDERYLVPSELCVVNEAIRAMASRLAAGQVTTVGRARSFYDHVAAEMTYGKPKDLPWGRGDTVYACDSRVGNCTDFHSYFISLCLAQAIPARFQIGIYGEYDKKIDVEYETGGYHCWAEFQVPGRGWVPVDISEADKNPELRDALFGGHTDNRVTLSTGRDLVLQPQQAAAPLNYFLYPYAELDGQPYAGVSKRTFWTDRL
ncbi:MAG: transglutaminase-like domain-containing protein [Planctomycetota bacterium]